MQTQSRKGVYLSTKARETQYSVTLWTLSRALRIQFTTEKHGTPRRRYNTRANGPLSQQNPPALNQLTGISTIPFDKAPIPVLKLALMS